MQWSDLLASLYILGHDITISDNATTFTRYVIFTLKSSPINELGEGACESGWWCQENYKPREQGTQASNLATQRVTTTTRHCYTEKLRGDAYQPLYSPRITKREGSQGGTNCHTKARFGSQKNCTTFPGGGGGG